MQRISFAFSLALLAGCTSPTPQKTQGQTTHQNAQQPRIVSVDPNLKCINPGALVIYHDKLYFGGYLQSQDEVIWSYDGVNHPTEAFRYPPVDGYLHEPFGLTVFKDTLYYLNFIHEVWDLFLYDGEHPPRRLDVVFSRPVPRYRTDLFVLGDWLYFFEYSQEKEWGLWAFDGKTAPHLVGHIPTDHYNNGPSQPFLFQEKLYFNAATEEGSKRTLFWATDGKSPPQPAVDFVEDSTRVVGPQEFVEFQGKLYFQGYDKATGNELWVYDGKSPPELLYDLAPGSNGPYSISSYPGDFVVFQDKLMFWCAKPGSITQTELWVYDGVNAPERVATDIEVLGRLDNHRRWAATFEKKLYFSARTEATDFQLWVYDGQNPPREMGKIFEGSQYSAPVSFLEYRGSLYFNGADLSENKHKLWVLDPDSLSR